MTVIAFDGRYVAADRMAVSGGGIGRPVTKIQRHGNAILVITGNWDIGAEMRAWWKESRQPKAFPESARKDEATLVAIYRDAGQVVIEHYVTGPHPMRLEVEKAAWGSGRDYAEAAMYLGKSAEEAVRVACHFQSDCGLGVDVLELT